MYLAHRLPMIRPTGVEPVKFTRRTASCPTIASVTVDATEREQQMNWRTPGGNPAWRKMSTRRYWVYGLLSDALRMAVLPHMMGVMKARTPRMMGAFQGAMLGRDENWRFACCQLDSPEDDAAWFFEYHA